MANTIQIKRSSTAAAVPTAGQLSVGELAVNLADKKLYSKDSGGTVIDLNPTFNQTNKIEPVTASVASSALTVTVSPTTLDFRSAALNSGTVNTRNIGTALSAVVPSGATLGTTNATLSRVMILAIDNAGTVEVAVCNGSLTLDESTLISTTALSADADSASVIYSTTARTNVPFRIVGFVESTQPTAGTWASSPSKIQGVGGQIRQGNNSASSLTLATAVTASGTSVDFTGIPSWAKKITVMFSGVSTNGTSNVLLQLGAGSVTSSGYLGSATVLTASAASSLFTAGMGIVTSNAASSVVNGMATITNIGSNIWAMSSNVAFSNAAGTMNSASSVTLSGTLDRVRITTVNGTDTFDAGTINIMYEG